MEAGISGEWVKKDGEECFTLRGEGGDGEGDSAPEANVSNRMESLVNCSSLSRHLAALPREPQERKEQQAQQSLQQGGERAENEMSGMSEKRRSSTVKKATTGGAVALLSRLSGLTKRRSLSKEGRRSSRNSRNRGGSFGDAHNMETEEDVPLAFGSVRDNIDLYSAGTSAGPSCTEATATTAATGAATHIFLSPDRDTTDSPGSPAATLPIASLPMATTATPALSSPVVPADVAVTIDCVSLLPSTDGVSAELVALEVVNPLDVSLGIDVDKAVSDVTLFLRQC
jgi:hypothetical protein